MQLGDTEFGQVFNASGARGFFGETTRFQWKSQQEEPQWRGSSFVAKTTTLEKRLGNMPFQNDGLTAQEDQPACIVVRPEKEVTLNAVGLSGPGLESLLEDGRWQAMTQPFSLSFMSVSSEASQRLAELGQFIAILKPALASFQAPLALQINFSCPNVGLQHQELQAEAEETLTLAAVLNIPLIPKFNLLLAPEVAAVISRHPACAALCISNTIPWGQLQGQVDFTALFDQEQSPLAHLGGGGLSGQPLLPLLVDWLKKAVQAGVEKPILAGGGILCLEDAAKVFAAGAQAISLGVISILHQEEVEKIISTYV